MRHKLSAGVLCAATLGVAWYACAIYDSTLLAPPDAGDGAADAGGDVASNDAGCVKAVPPARPPADDPSDADIELVFAVRAFVFDGPEAGPPPPTLGYDLDGLCTCPDPEACTNSTPHCDGPGGRDNSGAALLHTFETLSSGDLFSQQVIDDGLDGGQYGMLLRVRNYNGAANDTSVEVSAYIADGVAGADGGPTTPAWNGQDSWIVDKSSVFGAGPQIIPLHYDAQGYVAGGVLVGSFDYPLPLGFSTIDRLDVVLTHGFVTGTLTKAGNAYRIDDGLAGGRWAIADTLQQLAYVHDPANTNDYLCPATATYGQLKMVLCPALDLTVDPKAPSSASCDAISLVLGFSAQSARLGSILDVPRTTTCADAGPYGCP